MQIAQFECSRCGEKFAPRPSPTICPKDGAPLYVRYDLGEVRWHASRDSLIGGPKNMWRYAAVLPDVEPVTLGEGFTPLLPSRKYPNLLIKDEGLNPTGSFKAARHERCHHHTAALRREEARGALCGQCRRRTGGITKNFPGDELRWLRHSHVLPGFAQAMQRVWHDWRSMRNLAQHVGRHANRTNIALRLNFSRA